MNSVLVLAVLPFLTFLLSVVFWDSAQNQIVNQNSKEGNDEALLDV